jgi:HrpA-like RNA helicase
VSPDPRHAAVRAAIAECYTAANGLTVPWTGHTARVLATFLNANKTWRAEILVACVRNRFASEAINPAEDPIRWIRRLPNYARGPLDRFGKPKRLSAEEAIAAYWASRNCK